MTYYLIIKGLYLIDEKYNDLFINSYLKEIKFYYIEKEMMKIFESEEEYSEEDMIAFEHFFKFLGFFNGNDFYEYKNEILNICNLGLNIINNKRNERISSFLLYHLRLIFKFIPKYEEFLNIRIRIIKALIEFLTEKRKIISDGLLHLKFGDLSKIFKLMEEEENKLKKVEGFYEHNKMMEFIKDFKKEIEENGIEDCVFEILHLNKYYNIKE